MVFGVIWLVAVVGLVRRPDRRAVTSAWIVALLGLAMAVVLSRLVVTVPPVGTEVRPWVGCYLLIAFAALLVGGGIGVDGLAAEMRERSFSWLQPAAVLAGVAVGLVTLGGAAWWVLAGAQGPIERTRLDAIPPYVMNGLRSEARPRLLAIDLTGGVARYSVLSDGHLRLGDADRGGPFGGSQQRPGSGGRRGGTADRRNRRLRHPNASWASWASATCGSPGQPRTSPRGSTTPPDWGPRAAPSAGRSGG